MVTEIVLFPLPNGLAREAVLARFRDNAAMWRARPGLLLLLPLLAGRFLLAWGRRTACPNVGRITGRQWLWSVAAGLVLGYSARLAFGCNVGAFFSGISTGSLHGWVWFACAFAGSLVGVRLRERIGFSG